MPKTTLFAVDPLGHTHIRKTDRTYTHTVVVPRSYEGDLAKAHDENYDATARKGYYWRLEQIARKGYDDADVGRLEEYAVLGRDTAWIHESAARSLANAVEELKGCTDVDDFVAKKLAGRVALVEGRKAQGYYNAWDNVGWCGRRDLALKLAAGWPGGAKILEVQTKVKK